ncbi:MAG: hypothetical protein KTR32_39310 [Granulosicoccus sp.]|nr:hypothetical protein [Granulosicoccus sp.]
MKCNSCSTSMVLERTESSPISRSEWYNCPLCGQVRMTTRKQATPSHQTADATRSVADLYDDSALALN